MRGKLLTVAVLTILLAAGSLLAQPGPGKGGPGHGGCMGGPPGSSEMGQWMKHCDEMKLTDEQRGKIQKLKLEHQKEMMTVGTDIAALRNQMKLILIADKFDVKGAKKIAAELGKIHEKMAAGKAEHMRAVRDILTDEQKPYFDQKVLSGHFGMHDGPGKAKMGKHGKGRCW